MHSQDDCKRRVRGVRWAVGRELPRTVGWHDGPAAAKHLHQRAASVRPLSRVLYVVNVGDKRRTKGRYYTEDICSIADTLTSSPR